MAVLSIKFDNGYSFNQNSSAVSQEIILYNNGTISWPSSTKLNLVDKMSTTNINMQKVINIGEVPSLAKVKVNLLLEFQNAFVGKHILTYQLNYLKTPMSLHDYPE